MTNHLRYVPRNMSMMRPLLACLSLIQVLVLRVKSFAAVPGFSAVANRAGGMQQHDYISSQGQVAGGETNSVAAVRGRVTKPLRSRDTPTDDESSATGNNDEMIQCAGNSEKIEALSSGAELFGEPAGAGIGGMAATAADLPAPGRLVKEAMRPFQEEMDRIEAELKEKMDKSSLEIEKKLEAMLNGGITSEEE